MTDSYNELIEFEKAQAKKRRMTKFKILEVSCVDSPAQKGATATIMKRNAPMDTNEYGVDDATDDFRVLAKVLREDEGLSRVEALRKARRLSPVAFAKMQEIPAPFDSREEAKRAIKSMQFEQLVDQLAAQHCISKCDAMARARQEYPEEFAAAFGKEIAPGPDRIVDGGTSKRDWLRAVAEVQARDKCSNT